MDFDDMPIFMMRLIEETGGMRIGGAAHVGSVGSTVCRRSETSWRALNRSVPRLNHSSRLLSCGTDDERIVSTPGTPLSASSSGTLTSDSTSDAVRPRHAVWIVTIGGANSGKTSTFCSRSSAVPKYTSVAASATTRYRNFRLEATIQRMAGLSLLLDAVRGAQQ